MLAITDAEKLAWLSPSRQLSIKVLMNDVTYDSETVSSLSFDSGSISGETYQIGSTYMNSVEIVFPSIIPDLAEDFEVKPEIGILVNGEYNYTKLGTFFVTEFNRDRNSGKTTIKASDKMIYMEGVYESKLTYPAKYRDVAVEIANLSGVEIDEVSFSVLGNMAIQKPVGYTHRQAIGLIAQFEGGFASFNREGKLEIRRLRPTEFQIDADNYLLKGFTKNENAYRIGGITVRTGEEETDTIHVGSANGSQVELENKVMTKDLLNQMWLLAKDINYFPFELKWQGCPALEAGDWIYITDKDGTRYSVPNLSYGFNFNGGLTAESKATTNSSSQATYRYRGTLSQKVDEIGSLLGANNWNQNYYDATEPPNPKEGDTWFKQNGSDKEIWVYKNIDGVLQWDMEISSAPNKEILEAIDQAQNDIIDVTEKASDAVAQANQAVIEAGFANNAATTAIEQSANAVSQASNTSIAAQEAKQNSANAVEQAQQALTNANNLIDTVDGMQGTITSISTVVDEVNNQLAVKVDQTDFDKLSGTVSSQGTAITANANAISFKADSSTVNTIKGTVESLQSELSVQAGQIKGLVTKTDGTNTALAQLQIEAGKIGTTVAEVQKNTTWQYMTGTLDLNDFTTQGKYFLASTSLTNCPSAGWGYLSVETVRGGGTRIIQTYQRDNNNALTHQRIWNGTVWSSWKQIANDTDIATVTAKYSSLEQTVNGFQATVTANKTDADGKLAAQQSQINQNATSIQSLVTKTDGTNTALAQLQIEAGKIGTTVAEVQSSIENQDFDGRNYFQLSRLYKPGILETLSNGFRMSGWATAVVANADMKAMLKPSTTYRIRYKFRLDTLTDGTTPYPNQGFQHGTLLLISGVNGYPSIYLGLGTLDDTSSWKAGTIVERSAIFKTPANLYDEAANYRILGYSRRSMNGTTFVKVENGTFLEIKIETSSDYTGWSLAPEDQVTTSKFSSLEQTVNGFQATVQNDITSLKSQQTQLAGQITSSVTDLQNQLSTQVTQLTDAINLRVEKGELLSQINLEAGQTLIQTGKLYLDAATVQFSGQAFIPSAAIQDLAVTDAKIANATISSAKIISIDANKVVANDLSAITTNTGTLNVTGWLNFSTENRGMRGSYDFGDTYQGAYNYRWYEGDFRLSHRHLVFSGDLFNVNSSSGKGSKTGRAETYYGMDYVKLRTWNTAGVQTGRTDINAAAFSMGKSFEAGSNILLNADGGSYFKGEMTVASNIVQHGDFAVKTYTLQARDGADNVYINIGRSDLADFRVGKDGSTLNGGRVVQSKAIYDRTYSGSANIIVYDTGTIGRVTSARKYKTDIQVAQDVIADAKKVLNINPASWIDKGELADGRVSGRYYGFIADEFHELGLNEVVIYRDGEIESLAYDRIPMYHNVILTEHEKEIQALKQKINLLENQIKDLQVA